MDLKNFKVVFEQPEVEIIRSVSSTFFHYGFLTNVKTKKEYEFSLLEMYNTNPEFSEFELTFINDDMKETEDLKNFIVSALSEFEEINNLSENEAKSMLNDYILKNKEAIELLKQASAFIDIIRFEEGEKVDEDNLEGKINEFLGN